MNLEDMEAAITINSADIANITSSINTIVQDYTSSRFTVSDPFMEEVYLAIDTKLTKYSNIIYDLLKHLDRIEIEREEWLSLIDDRMKE